MFLGTGEGDSEELLLEPADPHVLGFYDGSGGAASNRVPQHAC